MVKTAVKLLILSNIHGGLPALEAVFNNAEDFDEILVLRDLVNYGPRPSEIVVFKRTWC